MDGYVCVSPQDKALVFRAWNATDIGGTDCFIGVAYMTYNKLL